MLWGGKEPLEAMSKHGKVVKEGRRRSRGGSTGAQGRGGGRVHQHMLHQPAHVLARQAGGAEVLWRGG